MNWRASAILILSLVLSWTLTWAVRALALRYQVVDYPDQERKLHPKATPLLGGLGVFAALALVTGFAWQQGWLSDGILLGKQAAGFLLAGAVLVFGGYLDDRYRLRPSRSFLFPLLATLVVISSGFGVHYITNPFGGILNLDQWQWTLFHWDSLPYRITLWADLLTFSWLLATTYTTKLLDGLDGLVAGVGAIGATVIYLVSLYWDVPQSGTSLLALALAGACLGFLIWNWHPARVFLGEGGSTLIGFSLGVLAIISGSKIGTALLLVGLGLLDVAWTVIRRLAAGRNPFRSADREHLHHLLLSAGLGQRQAVLLLYAASALFGLSALVLPSWGKLIGFGVVALVMALLVFALQRRRRKL